MALSNLRAGASYPPVMDSENDGLGGMEGTVFGGRYRIACRIGAGGMGTVYRAEQLALRMPVAIKVLHREFSEDPTHHRRFVREARVASRVVHPNVARVLDLGRAENGRVFMVMEHLQGEDLSELLARDGALPWARAREIILGVAHGLQAAHAIGVIHRDVKPSNVFLVDKSAGHPASVKVLDFGIAKSNDPESSFAENLTCLDKIIGTVEYMAPERVMGEAADARSDVYSLGVMIFEMLTGQPPWTSDGGLVRTLMRRVKEPPPELPSFLPGVPPEMVALVKRTMARDPDERFASLGELVAAIDGLPAYVQELPLGPRRAPRLVEEPRPAGSGRIAPRVRRAETQTWAGGPWRG